MTIMKGVIGSVEWYVTRTYFLGLGAELFPRIPQVCPYGFNLLLPFITFEMYYIPEEAV